MWVLRNGTSLALPLKVGYQDPGCGLFSPCWLSSSSLSTHAQAGGHSRWMPAGTLLLQHKLYFSSETLYSALLQNKSQQATTLRLVSRFCK